MKILITGSTGLVGSQAMSFFKEKGWEVIGIDNNMRSQMFGTEKREDSETFDIDIRNSFEINELFENNRFDAIIHTAAQPSHDYSAKEPLLDFHINVTGTLNLLEATRKYCPEATFVFASTDKVYGTNMTPPQISELDGSQRYSAMWERADKVGFDESLGLDFALRSPFGVSKTAADLYVQEYGLYFGIKTACFRLGCITGKQHAGSQYHGFLAYLAKCVREGIPYKIFGYKGKQVRDQIHAYDLVNAFWHFIQNPKIAAVYNMGGGPERSVSILEAIKLLEDKTGKKAVTEYVEQERKGDRIWDVHDVSKFRKDYPEWEYKYSLADIINELSD